MATTKKRINITLSDSVEQVLEMVARRDKIPQATKAANLLQFALEIEEDKIWNQIAEKRDSRKAQFLTHKKAWA